MSIEEVAAVAIRALEDDRCFGWFAFGMGMVAVALILIRLAA